MKNVEHCRRRYLDKVEEEAQKRKVGKKEKKTREVEKGTLETRSLKKSLQNSQKMAVEESFKNEGKRTGGLNPMQSSDWSQIKNEEEEESWQERDQMAEQWEEEQHLE